MSYRGFILPVSASDIKSIENLTIEELKQYLLNQQVDCFEGTKGDINFYKLLSVFDFNYAEREIHLGRWFSAFDHFCEMGKPLFNNAETLNMFYYASPFVAGVAGIRFLQRVFEDSMLSSCDRKSELYIKAFHYEIYHELLEAEREGELFFIYGY